MLRFVLSEGNLACRFWLFTREALLNIWPALEEYPWLVWLSSSESSSSFWFILNLKSDWPNPGGGAPFAFIWFFPKATSPAIEVKASGGWFRL